MIKCLLIAGNPTFIAWGLRHITNGQDKTQDLQDKRLCKTVVTRICFISSFESVKRGQGGFPSVEEAEFEFETGNACGVGN
jgi:hypothetical protein